MHLVCTCIIIFFSYIQYFKSKSEHYKAIVKVIEDEIYSELFEMYKKTEKIVLVKFVEVTPIIGNHSC